jgi:uncharacterized membrane protein YkoI
VSDDSILDQESKVSITMAFLSLLIGIGLFWAMVDALSNLARKVSFMFIKMKSESSIKATRGRLRQLLLVASTASIVAMFGMSNVTAQDDHVLARKLQESGQILSFEKIAEHARAIKAGEILETELELKKGRHIYEVEILDKAGKVWELKLNAKTGALIKMEVDD